MAKRKRGAFTEGVQGIDGAADPREREVERESWRRTSPCTPLRWPCDIDGPHRGCSITRIAPASTRAATIGRALRAYGMACSMSRLGNSWDNVAESRFPTQVEPGVHDALWPTRAPAPTEVFEYIEAFYRGRGAHLFTARARCPLTWLSTQSGVGPGRPCDVPVVAPSSPMRAGSACCVVRLRPRTVHRVGVRPSTRAARSAWSVARSSQGHSA